MIFEVTKLPTEWHRKTDSNKIHKKGEQMRNHEKWITNVQPLRSKEEVNLLLNSLEKNTGKFGQRNRLIGLIGVNAGMRISDILALRVSMLVDASHQIVKRFRNIDIKTNHTKSSNKTHYVYLNDIVRKEITKYLKERKSRSVWLFPSSNKKGQPLSTKRYAAILNQAAAAVNLPAVGTHTLRKSFGRAHYEQFHNVPLLQKILNHSNEATTLRYIGQEEDSVKESMESFNGFD